VCRDWLETIYVGAFQDFQGSFSVCRFSDGTSAWGVTAFFDTAAERPGLVEMAMKKNTKGRIV
jgi:hypothetical protein